MKRFILSSLILFIAFLAGFHVLSLWRGSYPYGTNFSPETLLKAARLAPSNPDPFYRLAVFHQWEINNLDVNKSLGYLWKAIERNPLAQEYWLSLTKILQRKGEWKASENALGNALLVFPTGYRGRWISGNLLVQQGEYEKAIPHFSYILTHYPSQSSLVFDVWGKAVSDPDFLLERLVLPTPSSLGQFLSYLYEEGNKSMAQKVWQKRVSLGYKADRTETLRHMEFLISRGEINEAHRVYTARLTEEGQPAPSEGNLIVNGGFEKSQVWGGSFDWKIEAVAGAQVSFDHLVAFEGKSSLKITFNGKENVDFRHVYQLVCWKPNQEYLLRARVKTKDLTTKSGIKFEAIGMGPPFYAASESLTGDNGWRELAISFRTPGTSQGGVIRVRREQTEKFDRFISGAVWIDNFQLTERKR
jgi:hypothetical protein